VVPASRRARPTIRCLLDDLGVELPGLDVDLGEIEHPLLEEVRRLAPTSPKGQKRILAIDHPLVYRIRVSDYRGATWVDEEHNIVWLCAARQREKGSEEDAYRYFEDLHNQGRLLPTSDDDVRDRAEAAIRLQRALTAELLGLVEQALATPGNEKHQDLGGWLPRDGCQTAGARPTLRRPRATCCSGALRAARCLANWAGGLGRSRGARTSLRRADCPRHAQSPRPARQGDRRR
jgi:hypothetical protein